MTQPTTWEEATQDVAVGLPSWRDGEDLTLDDVLQDIKEVLDELRDRQALAVGGEYATFRYLAWLGAVGYVKEKFSAITINTSPINFVEACDDAVRSVLVLLPKKQHDYGPDNILWGGVQGVVVRAHDKLARIKNLKKRSVPDGKFSGVSAMNEPLTDSYFDLIGYGIVGAMLVKGTFQLPLEADLPDLEKPRLKLKDLSPTFDALQDEAIRRVVRDEIAKREKAKSHG